MKQVLFDCNDEILVVAKIEKAIREDPNSPGRALTRESTELDFKASYGLLSLREYARTMAAFANTRGGLIVFGVTNSPRKLEGLQDKAYERFNESDPKDLTKILNEHFQPEIQWRYCSIKKGARNFGFIVVSEAKNKPVICSKSNGNELKEGTIYYRYSGRTEAIHYPELKNILDGIREDERNSWLNHFKEIAKAGVKNAAILNLQSGMLSSDKPIAFIDRMSLQNLRIIKEGEFNEVSGAPTLRLIGDIKAVDPIVQTKIRTKRSGELEANHLIEVFLLGEDVENPWDYAKHIAFENTAYFPVYYYISRAKLTVREAISRFGDIKSTHIGKNAIVKRLNEGRLKRPKYAFDSKTKAGSERLKYKAAIDGKKISEVEVTSATDVKRFCEVIMTVDDAVLVQSEKAIRDWVRNVYATKPWGSEKFDQGILRKVMCVLDEALYFDKCIID